MKLDMNKYDALNKDNIIEILDTLKTANNIDMILTKINELALEKYDQGFNDGYDSGELSGYADGWDEAQEDNPY